MTKVFTGIEGGLSFFKLYKSMWDGVCKTFGNEDDYF